MFNLLCGTGPRFLSKQTDILVKVNDKTNTGLTSVC